jgi:hypothetical protein
MIKNKLLRKVVQLIVILLMSYSQIFGQSYDDGLVTLKNGQNETQSKTNVIIDFGKMYDINYLVQLYESANGHAPDHLRIQFAEEYIRKQYAPLHDSDATKIIDIIQHVDPQDPFDIALLLFLFERNHMTIDRNRQWTIDDMPNTVTESVDFLLDNSNNYSIFKEKSC